MDTDKLVLAVRTFNHQHIKGRKVYIFSVAAILINVTLSYFGLFERHLSLILSSEFFVSVALIRNAISRIHVR
jgi:hypothetical protein